MKRAILVLAFAVACGGGKKADTTPTGGDDDNQTQGSGSGGPVEGDNSGNMLSPEKMDEAERDLNRKSMIMSQCLAAAMENGDVKRGAHGKVTLEIVIENAKASNVKVVKSDFQVQSITDCVIKHVQEIEFPQMKKAYETSHTYAMEAN